MEYTTNRSEKYYSAKEGLIADGIFSSKEIYDTIFGLILYYLIKIKEENYLPNINISNLQKQKNYFIILQDFKNEHFKKINSKDKIIYLSIFLSLELIFSNIPNKAKI